MFTRACIGILCCSVAAFAGEAEKKTIKADDGVSLVCEVRGQGETAIIFLHGWCGDRDYWKHQAEAFAKDYRIVSVDQAGHGESGKDRKAWTLDSLAGDMQAVVKALDLKRVILVGHSMGGPVALAAAKKMPKVVVAVIGVDTLQDADKKRDDEMMKPIIEGFEKDFKGTMQMGIGGLLSEKADPELKKQIVDRAAKQDQKMALALMRELVGQDMKTLLKEAKVPVRCINSAGGYLWFTPTSVENNKKYADYDAVLMENVGHYPMLEKPEEFNKKLAEVLKGLK